MATLKILAGTEQWITDVARIIAVGYFEIPKCDDEEPYAKRHDHMLKAARDAGFLAEHSTVHTVDFENSLLGIAIDVYIRGEENPQFWLVPRRSCFLMGDDGRTIDRI